MKITILDIFEEKSGSICYLSKSTLEEYIISLPKDYDQYDIQREIVGHLYLDNLINSLLEGKHIPPIVLILDKVSNGKIASEITLKNFKILDGLQRTFRLKYIYETIKFFLTKDFEVDFLDKSRLQLSKEYKKDLFKINSNIGVLTKLIDYAKKDKDYKNYLISIFKRGQWFEVWENLSPQDEVNKMLILNAGHKAVSSKHQIELLFNTSLPTLKKLAGNYDQNFKIVREKEKSSIIFSKERSKGEFHLSHIITGLLSYYEGKILTSNIDLIQNQQNNNAYAQNEVFLNSNLLTLFLKSLLELDNNLTTASKNIGLKWLGREITIVGMYGALGNYKRKNSLSDDYVYEHFSNKVIKNVSILNIVEFEKVRNTQVLSKINIGNINKKAIFNAIFDILTDKITEKINWENYFRGGQND